MANATFVHDGDRIDYTPAAAVDAGDVIPLGDRVGVATGDIAAGVLASLAVTGVFDFVKDDDSSTGTVFLANTPAYWDADAEQASPTKGILLGTVLAAAAKTTGTVRVQLSEQPLPAAMQNKVFETVTVAGGSKTLDSEDVGKVMNVTVGHASNVITLPATAGLRQFVIRCGTTGQKIAVSPNAADKLMGADLAGVDDKDRILAAADAVAGDYLHLAADGVDGYFVVAERGKWTAET
jgi:predicted RecA/RadA family phage recombinase